MLNIEEIWEKADNARADMAYLSGDVFGLCNEVNRLRKALEQIAEGHTFSRTIARNALEGGE